METATVKDARRTDHQGHQADRPSRTVTNGSSRPPSGRVVKRLDPTFDESNYGCRSFADLLKKHNDQFKIERGQHDHLVCLIE